MGAFDNAASLTAEDFDPLSIEGSVVSVSGLGVEIDDRLGALEMNARVEIETGGAPLAAEVASFKEGVALALPFGPLSGVKRGAPRSVFEDVRRGAPVPWLARADRQRAWPAD